MNHLAPVLLAAAGLAMLPASAQVRTPPAGTTAPTAPAAAPASGPTPAQAAATPSLGRLFLTPERRSILDRQRELNIQELAPKIEDPTVNVSGVVRRSSGPETAWINGVPQSNRDPEAIWSRTGQPGRISISTPDQETRQVSVGETLYRASGSVDSPLQGGQVGVYRPPAPGGKARHP